MKQLVHTTAEDQFLEDPEKAGRVTSWIKDTLEDEPREYMDKFIKIFGDDVVVQQYLGKDISWDRLYVHIQIIRSQLPATVYLSIFKCDTPYIIQRAKYWADSDDAEASIKGLNILYKISTQQVKPLRLNIKEANIYPSKEEIDQDDLIERIVEKIAATAPKLKPRRSKKIRKQAGEGESP